MNNRHLYKAKRLDNGEWVDGFYYCMSETTYAVIEDYERNPVPTHHYILFERMTDWGLPNQMMQVEVDPSTLCQCTGLTDKNDKPIWENDIVVFEDRHSTESGYAEMDCTGEVLWDDETLSFQVTERLSAESYEVLADCIVFGNIFDNPELLEVGE